ncbi:MAG: PEGA domain-containing protein [Myxococcales bacterium]|nr:PEGA domain-containing protein [Myxococcales bacterium]
MPHVRLFVTTACATALLSTSAAAQTAPALPGPTAPELAPAPTAAPPAAVAPDPEIALDLNAEFRAAVARHNRGDDSGAVRQLKEIAARDPYWADVFYNIGSLSQAMSHWDDCAFYYRRYLMLEPEDSQRRAIERNIGYCETGIYNGGTLHVVVTDPPNATIAINGIPYSADNAIGPVLLDRGTYEITATAYDHDPYSTTVEIRPQQTTELTFSLNATPQYGSVRFEVVQAGAEVFVDGESVGVTPLAEPIRLLVGTYHLEVRKEGYHPWVRNLEILRDLEDLAEVRLIDSSVDLRRVVR